MIISMNRYKKLLLTNEKLNKKVPESESQVKYLRKTNDEYFREAVKWNAYYDKMRKLFDNREIKSPIVEQRDAEIEALKHMLERVEAEREDYKTIIRTLKKETSQLVEQLSDYQRKKAHLHYLFKTKLEIAEIYHDTNGLAMWEQFLKEVE